MNGAAPAFAHLLALSDHQGIFEHALLDAPRRDHGYCVDDVARALIVVVREPQPQPHLRFTELTETFLHFLEAAIGPSGLPHNRMSARGRWTDAPTMGDWWGRALWALGVTAVTAADGDVRERALRAFHRAAQQRTPSRRTLALAALGSAEVAASYPEDLPSRRILAELVAVIPPAISAEWYWPEERLHYGNAVIPEALIAAGQVFGDEAALDRGLRLLTFLLSVETRDGRISVTGPTGRGPEQRQPLFDQQPIEVAAIAEASARAHGATGDDHWLATIGLAWSWFLGDNDSGTPMVDLATGAGFDGLQRDGRNENRGAESTLAALSTHQFAHRLATAVVA